MSAILRRKRRAREAAAEAAKTIEVQEVAPNSVDTVVPDVPPPEVASPDMNEDPWLLKQKLREERRTRRAARHATDAEAE